MSVQRGIAKRSEGFHHLAGLHTLHHCQRMLHLLEVEQELETLLVVMDCQRALILKAVGLFV